MKAEFLFAGINVNIITHKKSHFMDQGKKVRGIKYFNVETRLLFAPPIKISGYAPGCNWSRNLAAVNCIE